jgi:NAD(P)-dependent dehydrogenase (short-subunit alcohol dehydrogenase family)
MNARESKVAVVTGGTHGIGAAVARELAARSFSLVIIARDASRGVPFCEQLRREGAPDALFVKADLSLMSDVRQAARTTHERHTRIDVLVNNAAGMFPKRTLTSEGLEKTLALDYLAMALTEGLLPRLDATPNARVVNVVSKAALRGRLALDDLGMTRGYSGLAAYAPSISPSDALRFT